MSQSSQSGAPVDLSARLRYVTARQALTSRLDSLSSVQDAVAAQEWVMDAGTAVVHPALLLFFSSA